MLYVSYCEINKSLQFYWLKVHIITQASPSHQGAKAKQNKQQRYGQGQGQQRNGKKDDDSMATKIDSEKKENYLNEVGFFYVESTRFYGSQISAQSG